MLLHQEIDSAADIPCDEPRFPVDLDNTDLVGVEGEVLLVYRRNDILVTNFEGCLQMIDATQFHGRRAISYQRWSTTKQNDGDSQDRQDSTAQEFCRRHKLELVDTIRDQGVSAFRGSNVKAQLGRLIESYQTGEISKDVILIVDDYSRLTRMDASDAMMLFLDLIVSGITLGIARHDTFINKPIYDQNTAIPLTSLIGLSAANQESQQKSHAVKQAYKARARRLQAGEKIPLASVPFWIDRETRQILDDKRPVVERLVSLFREGNSYLKTASILNSEGFTTPKGSIWRQSNVQNILDNPALYGAVRFGDEVTEDFFEPVITKTQWDLFEDQKAKRRRNPASVRGDIANLFSRSLTCAKCGGPMFVSSTKKPNKTYRYVQCADNRSRVKEDKCGNGVILMDYLEESLLSNLAIELTEEREVVPVVDETEGKIKTLESQIEVAEGKLNTATERALTATSDRLRTTYEQSMETLSEQLDDMDRELTRLKTETPKIRAVDPNDLEEIFKNIDRDRVENRQALQARLARIVENVSLNLGSYQAVVDDPGRVLKNFKGIADVTLKDGSQYSVELRK